MKRFLISLVVLALLLSACGNPAVEPVQTIPTESAPDATSAPTVEVTEEPAEPPTEEPTEVPTEAPAPPEHSELYIPGVDVEDVILYFNEVALDAEVVNGGDASLLQKWTIPIRYHLSGECTEEDLAVLTGFVEWLNTIPGFPGMAPAQEPWEANLQIHFCEAEDMTILIGDWAVGMDGAVTFWYDNNEIYDATICYRKDIPQYTRNSVILEEIYNGLGPVQDTSLRQDSLIYAGFSEPQSLTEIDELLLKLLYHPEMECGMDAAACAEVIRRLYY